jgi:murein DD-endopeptidase MepM/ murein hydrolase activator NlpD
VFVIGIFIGAAPAPVDHPTFTAQPGDVVRVDGAVRVFDRQWVDLVGIDLDTRPGTYPIEGARVRKGATLRILPKHFPVRRLKVPENFVTPPTDEIDRIKRENQELGAIFARVSQRHWYGDFELPVADPPTSNFGTRSIFNGQPRSPHSGVDFMSAAGTPVHAGNIGVIVLSEPLYFTGNTVIIDYGDGLYSLFAHLSEFRVHTGDNVDATSVVGLVGATGRVTGPHLHWSVRLRRARVDPLSLVKATRAVVQQ